MSIYKACDIRGRVPAELNARECALIGRALADLAGPGARVLVAGDLRRSTAELKGAVIAGLQAGAARVVDLGTIPTPVAYFAYRTRPAEAVVIVTASHNPPDDNGVKFMLGDRPVDEAQMAELARRVERRREHALDPHPSREVEHDDPLADYEAWLRERFAAGAGRKVVLDPGHGSYSGLATRICRTLGYDIEALFDSPDGTFPGRPADSSQPRHLAALRERVRQTPGAVGAAFDGDGDRVAFVDELGRPVRAEVAAVLLLRHLVAAGSGESVVYDNKASMLLARYAERHGCRPLIERSGHAFIRARMLDEGALFGCEISGHYFYRELGAGDDGLYSALLLLESLQEGTATLAERVEAFPAPAITPDLRVPLDEADPDVVFARLRAAVPPERLSDLDGLRVTWDDGWALVRRSVTEPVLTLRFEGTDKNAMAAVVERFLDLAPVLRGPVRRLLAR